VIPQLLRTFAVAAALTCAACSSPANISTDSQTSKYTQTWSKSYQATTCTEWTSQMTGQQRFAAAADMLAGARNKGDRGSGLPPEALIVRFQNDVTEGCSVPATAEQLTVAAAGASVYLIGHDTYRP
jgi:hypothetical protein